MRLMSQLSRVTIVEGVEAQSVPDRSCPLCSSLTRIHSDRPCWLCHGTGRVTEEQMREVGQRLVLGLAKG